MGKRDREAIPKLRQPAPARDRRAIIKLVPRLPRIKPVKRARER